MKSIHHRVVALIVAFVSFALIAFGYLNYLAIKERGYKLLELETNAMARRLMQTLPEALWIADSEQIKNLVEAEGSALGLVAVELFNEEGKKVYSLDRGSPSSTVIFDRDIPLTLDRVKTGFSIGTLKIRVSSQPIEEELRQEQKRLILLIVSIDIFLAIALIVSIRRFMLRPVFAVEKALEAVSKSDADFSMRLPESDAVEFSGVNREFNQFIAKLERIMGGNVDAVHRAINKIAKGELDEPIELKSGVTRESVLGSLAQMQDNLLRMDSELRLALSSAESATRAKSEFLASMSHEIRTPMNVVIGMSHLALKSNQSSEQAQYLSNIHTAGQHLLSIINDILDFSKIESGKLAIEHIPFELETVLSNVATLFREKVDAKGIELVFDVQSDVPAVLVGDPLRIGQVLINYISNAIKFTDVGDIQVAVELLGKDGEDVLVRFSVTDTGVGIPTEYLERLFTNFEQGAESISRVFGGTGLGLAITKRLVALMNGEVGVKSEVAVGSKFWATVRLGSSTISSRIGLIRDQVSNLKVLVIDDNDKARDTEEKLLLQMGFKVAVRKGGKDGIAELLSAVGSNAPYDALIVDYLMPELNGIQVVERTKALLPSHLPKVILLAQSYQLEVFDAAKRVGIAEVVLKPVRPSDLFDSLMRILGREVNLPKSTYSDAIPSQIDKPPSLAGRKLLLVEDNLFNQKVALGLLAETGAIVDVASNGLVCIEMANRQHYDLILMDVQMPELDGIETTKRLRANRAFEALPIIAMTANAMPEDRIKCADAGMNDFVAKPIEPRRLWAVLSLHLSEIERIDDAEKVVNPVDITDEPAKKGGFIPAWLKSIESLNVQSGLSRALGNVERYEEYLKDFVRYQSETGQWLTAAASQDNWVEVSKICHILRGVSGHIGAERIQTLASSLESAAKRQEATLEEVAVLSNELAQLLEAIKINVPEKRHLPHLTVLANASRNDRLNELLFELLSQDDPRVQRFVDRRHVDVRNLLNNDADEFIELVRHFEFPAALEALARANKLS